jgi:tRNA G18 (ribose-2'-O)-methylase SpoU
MQVIRITDLDDGRLDDYARLTDVALRRVSEPAGGLYIAESTKVMERALRAGHRPRSVLLQEKWLEDVSPLLEDHDVPVFVGEPALLEQLTGFHLHRGALAAMHRPPLADPAELLADARRVVILEDIVDHTNVGAILRCCAALNVDAVLISPRCTDPLYRRSVRVSMGTVFSVPWTRLDAWPDMTVLHDAGFEVAALALSDAAVDLDVFSAALPERLALVFGTEGDGLTAQTVEGADHVVRIPMSNGVDSLNVAAAAGVTIWETRVRVPNLNS